MSASATAANKGEQTRATILETAVELASAEGLEGLTIGRLAAELRMSKSGLFAHFGSKQELQLATVAAAGERFRTEVIEPALALPPGAERLRAIGNGYLARVNDYAGGCFWFSVTAEYDDRPGPVRDAIAAAMDAWLGLIAAEARAAGHQDPERFAFDFYAAGLGANARFRLSGERRGFDYARDLLDDLSEPV